MSTSSQKAGLLLVAFCGCAGAVPSMAQRWPAISATDPEFLRLTSLVQSMPLDEGRRTLALTRAARLLQCAQNIASYEAQLRKTTRDNKALARRYASANSVVGALGSASAPAALASPVALVAPGLAFLWNVFGLTTLKTDVEPAIADDENAQAKLDVLKAKITQGRGAFNEIIMAPHSSPATDEEKRQIDALFVRWLGKTDEVFVGLSGEESALCPVPTFGLR